MKNGYLFYLTLSIILLIQTIAGIPDWIHEHARLVLTIYLIVFTVVIASFWFNVGNQNGKGKPRAVSEIRSGEHIKILHIGVMDPVSVNRYTAERWITIEMRSGHRYIVSMDEDTYMAGSAPKRQGFWYKWDGTKLISLLEKDEG